MRLAISSLVLLVAVFGCASSEMSVVNDAADAIGGADAIRNVNTLVIEGTGENFNLGQNVSPSAPLPRLTVNSYRKSIDFENGRWKLEQERTPTYVTANMAPNQPQVLAVDGLAAYNVAASGAATRAADQVGTDRHMELYHHPVGALRAALSEGAQITNRRTEGTDEVVDVTAGGDRFSLYVDAASNLPSKVVSMSYNVNLGDVAVETAFADYVDSNGMKLPGRLTSKTDKYVLADIRVSSHTPNGDVGNLEVPDGATAAAAPGPVTVEEAGKGVWYLTGGSHHSILIEFADYLALVEAPLNEDRTLAVIAKARELRPEKPLRYVINTHHHFDHSGGIRAAVSEGLTVITHEDNKGLYEEIVGRPHSIVQDALARNPQPLKLETVSGRHVLQDASRTVEMHHIAGNEHADTLLMVYLPAERILIQGDMFSPPAPNAPPPPGFPFVPNTVENIRKANLRVDTLLPIHGRRVPYSEMLAAAASETAKSGN